MGVNFKIFLEDRFDCKFFDLASVDSNFDGFPEFSSNNGECGFHEISPMVLHLAE